MILGFEHLSKHPAVFRTMTGLSLSQWSELLRDVLPRHARARRERLLGALPQQKRQRAFGGGQQGALSAADQVLLGRSAQRIFRSRTSLGRSRLWACLPPLTRPFGMREARTFAP